MIGASPVDTSAELETLIEQAIARDGLPNQVRQLTNPVFFDLEADLTRRLSTRGFRHDLIAALHAQVDTAGSGRVR